MLGKRVLLVLFSLLLGGCQMDVASSLDAAGYLLQAVTVTDSEVAAMGLTAAQQMDAEAKVAGPDNPYARRLAKLTANIHREAGMQLNFKVYLTDEVNAFALPDGSIRVYSGLMDLMPDDNELFFVIGHEIGHVVNGDTRERFRMIYTTMAARKGVEATGGRAAALARSDLGDVAHGFVNARFSQSQELAADDYGFSMLQKYKKPLAAAEAALRKLDSGGAGSDLFASHPNSAKRADRMAQRIRGGRN